MNLLIFFSVVIATIILAIVLQRIIHSPILVGFAFFSVFLVVAAVLNNITFIILAIALGILAFFAAFLDCIFTRSEFFRNNPCLLGNSNNNSNNNSNSNETLTILNSNGDVVARINGNTITCNNNCNNDTLLTTSNGNIETLNSNCCCNSRYYKR